MRLTIECEHGRSEAHSLGPTTDYAWCCPVEAIGPDAIFEALAAAGVLRQEEDLVHTGRRLAFDRFTRYVSPWKEAK